MSFDAKLFLNSPGKLYHLSLASSFEQVQRCGLLSTAALLDRFGIDGDRRAKLERTRRRERELIAHSHTGEPVYLNNQFPLFEGGLRNCRTDMTVEQWCLSLNSRVFFWAKKPNLDRLIEAQRKKRYRGILLSVEKKALFSAFEAALELSPINSGDATRKAAPRGSQTFAQVSGYPHDKVVEVTIPYAMMRTDLLAVEMMITEAP